MEATELAQRLDRIEKLITKQSVLSKPVLNIDEVVGYTGLSKLYLYKLTSKNEIPHYKPNGKNVYFKKEEINDWLLRNKIHTNEALSGERQTSSSKTPGLLYNKCNLLTDSVNYDRYHPYRFTATRFINALL